MPTIRVTRGRADIPALTETQDETIALDDHTKAFVRLGQGYNNPYCILNDFGFTTYNTDVYSCAVEIVDNTTLRFHSQPGGTSVAKRVWWEIWEYIGEAGGPSEFIVRQKSNVLITGTGGADANPWTMSNSRYNFVFNNGIVWEGAGAGAASVPHAGMCRLQCDTFFGFNWFRYTRGSNPAGPHNPRVYYSAVEFTGVDWQARWCERTGAPPVGVTVSLTLLNQAGVAFAIPDWDKAFIHAQRVSFTNDGATQGMYATIGSTNRLLRLSHPAGANGNASLNYSYAQVLYNDHIDVDHQGSYLLGDPDFVGTVSFQTQQVAVPDPQTLAKASVFSTYGMDNQTTYISPGNVWQNRIEDDGGGGTEVEWELSQLPFGVDTTWTQMAVDMGKLESQGGWNFLIDYPQLEVTISFDAVAAAFVAAELGPTTAALDGAVTLTIAQAAELTGTSALDATTGLKILTAAELNAASSLDVDLTVIAIGFIDGHPVILVAASADLDIGEAVDADQEIDVAVIVKNGVAQAVDADQQTSPSLETQEIEVRKGKDPR